MKPIPFDKRVCVCGGTKFHMMPKTFLNGQTTVGLYCSECGQWQKWMNKKDRSRFEALQCKEGGRSKLEILKVLFPFARSEVNTL